MNAETLAALLEATGSGRPVVLATRLAGGEQEVLAPFDDDPERTDWPIAAARDALLTDTTRVIEGEGDGDRIMLRPYNPRPRLVIVGAVHVAQHLVELADTVGFEVSVVDPREAFARRFRFPDTALRSAWPDEAFEATPPDHRTAVVILTHDPKLDDPAVLGAVKSPAFYIGVLGSRRTHAKRVERLREQGLSDADLERLHAPIGLDIGARTPAEIALAIMAEVVHALRVR